MFNTDYKAALKEFGNSILFRVREMTVRNSLRFNGYGFDALREGFSEYGNTLIGYRNDSTIADFSHVDNTENHPLITGTPDQVLTTMAAFKTPRIIGKAYSHKGSLTSDKATIQPAPPLVNLVTDAGQEGVIELVNLQNNKIQRTFTVYKQIGGELRPISFSQIGTNPSSWGPWTLVQDGNEYHTRITDSGINQLLPTATAKQTIRLRDQSDLTILDEDEIDTNVGNQYLEGTVFTIVNELADGTNYIFGSSYGITLQVPYGYEPTFSKNGAVVTVTRLSRNNWLLGGDLDKTAGYQSPYFKVSEASYADNDIFTDTKCKPGDFHQMNISSATPITVKLPIYSGWHWDFPIGSTQHFMIYNAGQGDNNLPVLDIGTQNGITLVLPKNKRNRISGNRTEFRLTRLNETTYKLDGDLELWP